MSVRIGYVKSLNDAPKTVAPSITRADFVAKMNGMAIHGPAPKTLAVKRAEGFRGHHPKPQSEPLYPCALPDRPAGMSAAAVRLWKKLVGEMSVSGVLKRVDANALAQLCEDEVTLKRAQAELWRLGAQLKADAKREKRKLPGGELTAILATEDGAKLMRTIRDLGKSVVNQRDRFGLNPSSRSRLVVAESERPQDEIDLAVFSKPVQLLVMPKP
jgi:P27 family predicted phage terminase small subunit